MKTIDKEKSLLSVFDNVKPLKVSSNITDEEYKQIIHQVTYMMALAYDKGFEDGKNDMWGQIYDPLYNEK